MMDPFQSLEVPESVDVIEVADSVTPAEPPQLAAPSAPGNPAEDLDRLEWLHQLVTMASGDPQIDEAEVEGYLAHLVSIGPFLDEHETTYWEAAMLLLLLSDDHESLFDTYGYPAVAASTARAIEAGVLPRGLGWCTAGFRPTNISEWMLAVVDHPLVKTQLCAALAHNPFSLNLDLIPASDQELKQAVIQLLAELPRLNVAPEIPLTWAARLVEHLAIDDPVRSKAVHLVLQGLCDTGRYVNAFYWLEAFYSNRTGDRLGDVVFEVVTEIVRIAGNMPDEGARIIGQMSFDPELELLIGCSPRAQVLLSFAVLWATFTCGVPANKDFVERSLSVLWNDYTSLASFIQCMFEWSLEVATATNGDRLVAIDYIKALEQRKKAVLELRDELDRPHNYRNVRKGIELWRDCESVLRTLVNRLNAASSIRQLREIEPRIRDLDAAELIRESDVHGAGGRQRQVLTNVQKMVAQDLENCIERMNHLVHLSDLAFQTSAAVRRIDQEAGAPAVEEECTRLRDRWPTLEEPLNAYLVPVLSEWQTARALAED